MKPKPTAEKTAFLARQGDLFPRELHQAELESSFPSLKEWRTQGAGGAGAARSGSEDGAGLPVFPPATNRGGKSESKIGKTKAEAALKHRSYLCLLKKGIWK